MASRRDNTTLAGDRVPGENRNVYAVNELDKFNSRKGGGVSALGIDPASGIPHAGLHPDDPQAWRRRLTWERG